MGFLSKFGLSMWAHILYRLVQMLFGIVVIGLYAQDLNHAHKEGKYSDGKWVSRESARAYDRIEDA